MKNKTRKTLKIYWQHILKHKTLGFLILFSIIGAAVLNAYIPVYFKKFFDILTSGESTDIVVAGLIGTLVMIAVLEFFQWLFWRIAGFASTYFQSDIMAELSSHCYSYLLKHSFNFFNNNFVGSLVKRVKYFVNAFEGIIDRLSWSLIPLVINLVVMAFVLYQRNVWLVVGITIWVVIFMTVNYIFVSYKMKYDIAKSKAESENTAYLADTITNNSNVKLFNGHDREVKGFWKTIKEMTDLRKLTWNLDNIFEGIQGLLMIMLEIAVFYLAIRLWQKGQLTVGDFVLLQAYLINIFMRVWDFGRVIRNIYRDLADAEEMTEILLTPHEIRDVAGAKKLKVAKGEVEFKEVDFYYHKTRPVLDNFNLKIKAGERLALIGPSGAGKSTIVKLLLRNHDVAGGKILIDGQNIAKATQESLWQSTSLVPQDPMLFHRTLMDNIRYGKPSATDKEVMAAAKMANCDEFISGFPEGYKTFVGERGVKLSGGERQRVAIARAMLRNAPILVLDEATSSLDSESEGLIQDALGKLMKGKTVIVIAHRLSTIRQSDRIIVVDEGGIVEEGSHDELSDKKGGLYAKLWRLQAGGFIE